MRMPRAVYHRQVCPPALKGARSGARWLVAAWLAFAAAVGFGVLARPEPARAELEASGFSAAQPHSEAWATRPEWVAGAVDPLLSATLESPSATGATAAARGRPDARAWAGTGLHAQADAIIRRLGSSVLRQDNGRMADRPSLCICSAQGPPV